MQQRQLGARGPRVPALGLGCMGMSGMYGPADRAESIATIHAALDVALTPKDVATIEAAIPKGAAAGERYAPVQMKMLDGEGGA